MPNKKRVAYVMVLALMCAFLCGFVHKSYPVLNTEEKFVYEYYDISKIQTDASLGKNSNLVDKNIVFVGEVSSEEKNNKTIYINGSNIKVELPQAIKFSKGDYALIYGVVNKPKNSIAIITAKAVNITKSKEMEKGLYTFSVDKNGVITSHCYNNIREKELSNGQIAYSVPTDWIELNGDGIFNTTLLEEKNAACYRLNNKEYVGVIFFNYNTFIAHDSDMKKKRNIECAIIQNICPGEEDRISLLGMTVPQETFSPIYGAKQDAYVAVYDNYDVEFNFQETNEGLFIVVYMYDNDNSHAEDVVYMLSTVKY